ncbi:MAG: hypothetical protein KGN78_10940 [Actinomycetales bacterium]|nr:hypothetical protein [Actinomycetales bacterium]
MITGWSLEQPVSEEQFLRRELGVDWQVDSAPSLAKKCRAASPQRPLLLICSEPDGYRELLDQAPTNSIVLIMLSDEAYTPERLDLVRNAPALRAIYRHYTLTLANPLTIVWQALLLVMQSIGTSVRPTAVLALLRIGRATRSRMRAWQQVTTPVHVMPLGYTNRFAEGFVSLPTQRAVQQPRQWQVVFRGAGGQPQRQVMLDRARRRRGALIQVLGESWSGFDDAPGGDPYVEQLLDTEQALCPPGFINIETFRAYEALLCGATPIEPRVALTHGGKGVCTRTPQGVRQALDDVRVALIRDTHA